MSAFGGLILTNKGRNLQAKAQIGAELHFNRIAVGDGELGGSSILDLTALKNEVKSLDITKLKTLTAGKAVVGGILSNDGLAAGFYWRELGLFAQDPDEGEILYCYGNSAANAEYIPAGGGPDIVEKTIDIVAIVGNATSVTATIDQSLIYASAQDLTNHINKNASETEKGHIQLATTEEAVAGADIVKAITAAGLKAAINALINAAPGALDTLDELAQALSDDPNFATTITNMISGIAGAGRTTETVKGNADAIAAHKSESASTTTKGHVQLYNGTDSTSTALAATANAVKAAMDKANSAFQSASDGKTSVVNAIGSGEASTAETFAQISGHITADKNTLATNLTNKGQNSAGTEALAALVAKVANINTGRKWASGTAISTQIDSYMIGIEVSGLGFKPNIIICYFLVNISIFYVGFYCADISTVACYYYELPKTGNQAAGNGCYSLALGTTTGDDYYVINGAFKICTNSTSDNTGGFTFNWIAIE